jgi:hypothetical protein
MWSLSSQSIGVSVRSTENTVSSIVACWAMFIELLPGNTIKSVTIFKSLFIISWCLANLNIQATKIWAPKHKMAVFSKNSCNDIH